jgi:hypothetical protein
MVPQFKDGWRLLSDDPEIGQRRWIMRNPEDPNQWIVKTETWVPSMVAEANEKERNATAGQRFGNFRKVASIPLADLYGKKFGEAFKADDMKYILRKLDDPDNRHLRTFEGRLT